MIYEIKFLLVYQIIFQAPISLFDYQVTTLPQIINTQMRFSISLLRGEGLLLAGSISV